MPLANEIRAAINRCSRENISNTPDFILAEYLLSCLAAFESASMRREEWYGRHLSIGGNARQPEEPPANGEQLAQPAKCLDCEYWQKPRGGFCLRGDRDTYCVKVGTQQASAQ